MNSETIMKSDVLDILFEKRNKLYGAYTLRKFYNNRLLKSIGITIGAVSILCAFTFIPKKPASLPYTEVELPHFMEPKAPDAKKELPKRSARQVPVTQKKFLTPIIAAKNIIADTLQNIEEKDVTGAKNSIVPGISGTETVGTTTGGIDGGNGNGPVTPVIPVNPNEPVANPDVLPAYPGGIDALRRFLQKNLVNPTDMEEGEMVAVNVRFVVGYDGKLQKFAIVKDGGELYNNEVIRVMKKMPQWIPGKAHGENVAVYFTIPVKFVPAD